jgi:4-amino-4-deoxy-L-arabinose transferase-like glycosyltransferase
MQQWTATTNYPSTLKKLLFGCIAFAVLSLMILHRPAWKLRDFDQIFYVTIAYDLDRYGVFSNGLFADIDSNGDRPSPGMFFGPVYPMLVLAAMKIDGRFAAAVKCIVEAEREHRDEADCEAYAFPIRLMNAWLLVIGLLAVACAAELIVQRKSAFLIAGLSALAGLAAEIDIFSYVMTESAIFAIYSLFALQVLLAWKRDQTRYYIFAGGLLGLLCLTKPSFALLFPVIAGLSLLYGYRLSKDRRLHTGKGVLAFSLAFAVAVALWAGRNAMSVGKFGLTEEYGAAALIERFAFDEMTMREFWQAFPYCTPGVGDLAFDQVYGTDSMHRFVYHTPGSFFHVGRDRRDTLVRQYKRLDPLIADIVRDEMHARWWRYLLVSIPLAWCGMWAGWLASIILLPAFLMAFVRAYRTGQPLFLMYAAPALTMLGLHAAVGNHYIRYNLILIGPYAVGMALIVVWWARHSQERASARAVPKGERRV